MAPMKSPVHHGFAGVFTDTISLTHLAQRWHMQRRDIRQLVKQCKLPFVEVEHQLRIPLDAVEELEHSSNSPLQDSSPDE